jgi:hypothetical protein
MLRTVAGDDQPGRVDWVESWQDPDPVSEVESISEGARVCFFPLWEEAHSLRRESLLFLLSSLLFWGGGGDLRVFLPLT